MKVYIRMVYKGVEIVNGEYDSKCVYETTNIAKNIMVWLDKLKSIKEGKNAK